MLQYPYPQVMDLRMNQLQPITSPDQGGNRILPTYGGMGACSCQSAGHQPPSSLGQIVMMPAATGIAGLRGVMSGLSGEVSISPLALAAAAASGLLYISFIAAGAYHGYQRNGTPLSTIGYGVLAAALPPVGAGVMLYQGVAEKN